MVYLKNKLRTEIDYLSKIKTLRITKPKAIIEIKAWPPSARVISNTYPSWITCKPNIKIPNIKIEKEAIQQEKSSDNKGQIILPCCLPTDDMIIQHQKLEWTKWFKNIPTIIREIVKNYESHQWEMLVFLANGGREAIYLSYENPALAFALASNHVFRQIISEQPFQPEISFKNFQDHKQEILFKLGFFRTKEVEKILSKVILGAINTTNLHCLRQITMDNNICQILSKLKRINTGVINMLSDTILSKLVSPNLIEEIANDKNHDKDSNITNLLYKYLECFYILSGHSSFNFKFKNLDILNKMLREGLEDLNLSETDHTLKEFPPPPFVGTENIFPITNSKDLIREGFLQRNCVAKYINQIANRKNIYFYRTIKPERCTLAVFKKNNKWRLFDIKRAFNEEPRENTRNVVRNWLNINKVYQ